MSLHKVGDVCRRKEKAWVSKFLDNRRIEAGRGHLEIHRDEETEDGRLGAVEVVAIENPVIAVLARQHELGGEGLVVAFDDKFVLPSEDSNYWIFYRDNLDGSQSAVFCFFVPMNF